MNCDPKELVWTSGATESINLALKGAANFYRDKGKHLVTVRTEHKATLDTMRELERDGFEVTYLDVLPNGLRELGCDVTVIGHSDHSELPGHLLGDAAGRRLSISRATAVLPAACACVQPGIIARL